MQNSEVEVGCWNSISDVQVVSLLAKSLDFLIIDLEHGFRDFSEFSAAFASSRQLCDQVYVRVRKFDDPWIQSLLDLGVSNFVIPQIRSISELESFVTAATFPPKGRRGFHPRAYQNNFSSETNGSQRIINEKVRICLIIETRESLEILDELCSNPSLDEIYIGVYDLSLELEITEGVDSTKMLDICRKISHVAQFHSKKIVAMMNGEDSALELQKMGVSKFVVGVDSSILEDSILAKAKRAHSFLDSKDA